MQVLKNNLLYYQTQKKALKQSKDIWEKQKEKY